MLARGGESTGTGASDMAELFLLGTSGGCLARSPPRPPPSEEGGELTNYPEYITFRIHGPDRNECAHLGVDFWGISFASEFALLGPQICLRSEWGSPSSAVNCCSTN